MTDGEDSVGFFGGPHQTPAIRLAQRHGFFQKDVISTAQQRDGRLYVLSIRGGHDGNVGDRRSGSVQFTPVVEHLLELMSFSGQRPACPNRLSHGDDSEPLRVLEGIPTVSLQTSVSGSAENRRGNTYIGRRAPLYNPHIGSGARILFDDLLIDAAPRNFS